MTKQQPSSNDLFQFAAEVVKPQALRRPAWKILIADDDEEVHTVTRLALKNLEVMGRPIEFLSAYSAAEALELLRQDNEIAVVLLDVVMENEYAGLDAVKHIRNIMHNHEVRIILRTGQPGYAPEESVIQDYDINDYKTKNELTRAHLVTAIVASLRSFQQIRTINQNRVGLEKIIHAGANLMELHSLQDFSDGVITQISSLLGLNAEGVLCACLDDDGNQSDQVLVMGAAGRYAEFIHSTLDHLANEHIVAQIQRCLEEEQHIYGEADTTLYIGHNSPKAAVYIQTHHPILDNDRQLIEVFLNNISVSYENVALFQQLRHAAYTDPLTRTPNRNEFTRLLSRSAQHSNDEPRVVVLIDINHFSDINDGLGQEVGNALLQSVARRLQLTFGDFATIARIDADVFGLIGDELALTSGAIQAAFEPPFEALEHHLPISATLGYARFADIGDHGLTMLKRAYIALNAAKKDSTLHTAYFSPSMEQATQDRLDIVRSLQSDFDKEGLELWYQPQIDLTTHAVIGMEALLRWPQPDGSFIPPDTFIPIAEYSGLIVDIGLWVLRQACQQLQSMQAQNLHGLRIAVNVSMPQFRNADFPAQVARCLKEFNIKPRQIELEITESIIMDEPQVVITALHQLKALGVQIALDDFGTGFSSLNYLRQLPLDRIKVDRAFVHDIDQPSGAAIAETIIGLGKKLGLHTIAEGIETEQQERALKALGCDEAQGYHYAKPMPTKALLDYLRQ
ncbi:EAL domain-containing protein [Salinispirillum sp. LH 10-3-1]|uniref:EAL domain-containing protein n=1 Tax=Salinispirillum sp. LH 10-3-1 TaxID=2952525 RepID=A0AB38YDP9_9GAMM